MKYYFRLFCWVDGVTSLVMPPPQKKHQKTTPHTHIHKPIRKPWKCTARQNCTKVTNLYCWLWKRCTLWLHCSSIFYNNKQSCLLQVLPDSFIQVNSFRHSQWSSCSYQLNKIAHLKKEVLGEYQHQVFQRRSLLIPGASRLLSIVP